MKRHTIYLSVCCSILLAVSVFSCTPAVPEEEEAVVEEEEAAEKLTEEAEPEEEALPKPAEFTVASLSISDDEIERYRSCTVTVDVTNIGEVEGDYEVTLCVDDEIVETKQVTLGGGATETVNFSFSESESGTYDIDVNGLSGTLKVKASPPPSTTKPPAPPSEPKIGTWTYMDSGIENYALHGAWCFNPYDVFVAGDQSVILHYDGKTWYQMTHGNIHFRDIWGSSISNIFAVGEQGLVAYYNGTEWEKTTIPGIQGSCWGISGISESDIYIVGDTHIFRCYGINAWDRMNYSYLKAKLPSDEFKGVWYNSSSDVYVVGAGGTILHYDGTEWTIMDSGTTERLTGIWGSSSSDIFAVGRNGTILHYDGSNWSQMDGGTRKELTGIWGSSSTDVFVVGKEGTILHYDGESWSLMESGTTKTLYGIGGYSSSCIFAVGSQGTILHYEK